MAPSSAYAASQLSTRGPMKHRLFPTLIALLLSVTGFASKTLPEQEPYQIINLNDLTPQQLEEIGQGFHQEAVVEFPAHTKLPLKLSLEGDLFKLNTSNETLGEIEVLQTFYARFAENMILLSSDLHHWKPFMEFVTGSSSVGLSFEHGLPFFSLGAFLDRRQ